MKAHLSGRITKTSSDLLWIWPIDRNDQFFAAPDELHALCVWLIARVCQSTSILGHEGKINISSWSAQSPSLWILVEGFCQIGLIHSIMLNRFNAWLVVNGEGSARWVALDFLPISRGVPIDHSYSILKPLSFNKAHLSIISKSSSSKKRNLSVVPFWT